MALNTLCCIQARISSTRLPGKVIKRICGKPLLLHVIERVLTCELIDRAVLATSTDGGTDVLADIAEQAGIGIFRGSEDDVLDRYYRILLKYKPTHVVRICADSPLVDPFEIDRIIRHHVSVGADYSFNHIPEYGSFSNGYPDGVGGEIFKSAVLKSIAERPTTPAEREHVNKYVLDRPGAYHIETIQAPAKISHPKYRFDVDSEEDLAFIREIFQELYNGTIFSTEDVVTYLERRKTRR